MTQVLYALENQLMIYDWCCPRARGHWVEDDGAARLEATEKGLVERREAIVRNFEARKNPIARENQVFKR